MASPVVAGQDSASFSTFEASNGDLSSLRDEYHGDSIQPLNDSHSVDSNDFSLLDDSAIELELKGGSSSHTNNLRKQQRESSRNSLNSSLHSLDLDDIDSVDSSGCGDGHANERKELAMERSYGSGIYHTSNFSSPGGSRKSPSMQQRGSIVKGIAKLCAFPEILEKPSEDGSVTPPESPLYQDLHEHPEASGSALKIRRGRGPRPTRGSFERKVSRSSSGDSFSSVGMSPTSDHPKKKSSFFDSFSSLSLYGSGQKAERQTSQASMDSLKLQTLDNPARKRAGSHFSTASSVTDDTDSSSLPFSQNQGSGNSSGMYNRMLSALNIPQRQTSTGAEDDSIDDGTTFSTKRSDSCYTLGDHAEFLKLACESDPRGWYYCDIGHLCLGDYKDSQHIPRLVKDYLWPVPLEELSQFFRGLKAVPHTQSSDAPDDTQEHAGEAPEQIKPEPLPVRTIAFRLRPDVSNSKVIDAVRTSFESTAPGEQHIGLYTDDNHFRAMRFGTSTTTESRNADDPDAEPVPKLVPYTLDAQVCMQKTDCFERYLVLRIFHPTSQEVQGIVEVQSESAVTVDGDSSKNVVTSTRSIPSVVSQEDATLSTNLQLRQASSLVQLFFKNSTEDSPSPKRAPISTSAYLMYHYDSSQSVQDVDRSNPIPNGTIWPALNALDWEVIETSESMCEAIWKSLLSSSVCFSSVTNTRLGNLGFVNILDPQYCKELETVAKESSMIEELRKAKEGAMMKHAALMEEKYANFIRVINGMWETYQLEMEPAIQKTREPGAKNEIPNEDGDESMPLMDLVKYTVQNVIDSDEARSNAVSPEHLVDQVIKEVYSSIEEHLDRDFRESCKRLNRRVTARIGEIKSHQEHMIRRLESAESKEAKKHSEDYYKVASSAKNMDGHVSKNPALGFPILVLKLRSATSSGTCYVTTSKLLYHMPGLLGQKRILDLKHIEFEASGSALLVLKAATSERLIKLYPVEVSAADLQVFFETLRSFLS